MWWLLAAFAGPIEDGIELLKAGKPHEAQLRIQSGLKSDTDNVEGWWELGWAFWAQEKWPEAMEAWERVEKLDPQHDELQHWLSTARTRVELAKAPTDTVSIPTQPSDGRIRFAAAGDTMMGSDLRKGAAGLADGDGESLFTDTAPLFSAADIAFLNLEGPLADGLPSTKCGPKSTSCYAFRTPTRYTAALKAGSIDVTSLANNHAFDLGPAGQQSTMDALDAAGIAHAGRYGDVAFVQRNGKTIAFLAAHSGSCCLNVNKLDEIQAAVRQADAKADLVVLSFHGGAEGSRARHVPGKLEIAWGEKRGDVKALAHGAIDAGADLILGHGPHVLRGMEVYKERLVVYSMGNFIGFRQFGTKGGYGGTSVIVDAELADNGVLVSAKLHALALDDQGVPHPDPSKAAFSQVRELSAADFPDTGVKVSDTGVLTW